MDDDQFKILLDHLGYSWSGYRKVRKGVKKRIRRHMQDLACRDIYAYLDLMAHQAESRHECELLMTVSISRFFRDRQMWQMLESRWLPDVLAGIPPQMNVWSAGCACGEEVYTFKIVWAHMQGYVALLPPLQILASDRNPQHVDRARCGVYNRSSLKEVAAQDRAAFFESRKGAKQFAVKYAYKSGITWEIRDLLTELPARRFQIIFLRNNILTYCRQEVQLNALMGISVCLSPRGFLILGCHERLPLETAEFVPMNECPYVYQKR
jgi:chemotaxis methyl-accepting protein methylase